MRIRVLLVEDNETNQEIALALLTDVGCVVDLAANGALAVAKLEQTSYDIVLMDMQMPVMDGITATVAIRQLPQCVTLPILAMTANAMHADRERCLAAGMSDYIAKPIEPSDLWSKMVQWIPPKLPGVDLVAGLRHLAGNKKLYRQALNSFLQNQSDIVLTLQRLFDQGEITTAERRIHTLKGLAGTIGATDIERLARQLETTLQQEGAKKSAALLNELDTYMTPLLLGIAGLLASEKETQQMVTSATIMTVPPVAVDLLAKLELALQSRQAQQSRLLLEELEQLVLPIALAEILSRLAAQIRRYRFKEAQQSLQEMLHQCGKPEIDQPVAQR
ncbi:MAG: response regulator [Magnetococcales bacterium]|nr:response regulator [Magnetococcales bacterium]